MQESTTVRAETVEKAVNIALTKLNLSRDEAEINIISEGKKGLFGFGKQDAIVEVTAKKTKSIGQIMDQLDHETKAETVSNIQTEEAKTQTVVETVVEPEEEVEVVAESVEVEEKEVAIEDTDLDDETEEDSYFDDESDEDDEEDVEDVEDADDNVENAETKAQRRAEANQKVATYLQKVILEYGAEADITVEDNGYQIIFNIDTDKSGLVIGKHGKIINALQTLAQILLHRYNRRRVSVILNVGDYRNRRASVLEQIAERTANEVLRTKQAVILDPLPAYERKQIHAYLSKVDRVKTHSEGKDPNRYLVVEYDNKLDY